MTLEGSDTVVVPPAGIPIEAKKLLLEKEGVKERKSAIQRLRRCIYMFLERPETRLAMVYHLSSFGLILGSLCVSILSTMEEFHTAPPNMCKSDNASVCKTSSDDHSSHQKHSLNPKLANLMLIYELTLLSWFSLEFILRLWSCSYVGKYCGFMGRMQFMKSFYMLVDAFVIVATTVTAILQINASYFTILRITRFMQIFRILRIDRQRGDLRFMGKVVREHSKELVTCYFVGFIILFTGTYIVYVIERISDEEDGKINNMANGLYWAIITVTSVGYGDFSPQTWPGKVAVGIFALIGCAFFSLPAGILGSGFALQVAKQKKEKQFVKVKNPAAIIIQSCWRNYAIKQKNWRLEATWKYLLPQLKETIDTNATVQDMTRFELRRADKLFVPAIPVSIAEEHENEHKFTNNNNFKGKIGYFLRNEKRDFSTTTHPILLQREDLLLPANRNVVVSAPQRRRRATFRKSSSNQSRDETVGRLLRREYRGAIRFMMRCKYWNAVKAFKNAHHPFVNIQDIMEKNKQGHIEMLSQLKEMKEAFEMFLLEFKEMQKIMISSIPHIPQDVAKEKGEQNDIENGNCKNVSDINRKTFLDDYKIEDGNEATGTETKETTIRT